MRRRDHRPRLRRAAARRRLRRGRASRSSGVDVSERVVERPERRPQPGRGCPDDARLAGLERQAARDHRRGHARRLRRGPDLRADAARQPARARPLATSPRRAARWPRSCARASWSCSSRPPIPGTTRERLQPILEESGLTAGRDFHLAFSPERIDPGRTDHTIRTTPKVVGGLTDACRERAVELYSEICDEVVAVSTPRGGGDDEAAREHLPLGQHRARQRARGALRADGDRRLGGGRRGGDQALRVHALRARARDGRTLPARSIPSTSPSRRASTTSRPSSSSSPARSTSSSPTTASSGSCGRSTTPGKPARDSRVLLLGVSYKTGVGDMRESPALKIAHLLRELGAEVAYHDPHVAEVAELGLELGRARRRARPLRRRLRDHRPRRGRLRARRRRGAAGGRLPRRHPRDRGRQPDPPLDAAGDVS